MQTSQKQASRFHLNGDSYVMTNSQPDVTTLQCKNNTIYLI